MRRLIGPLLVLALVGAIAFLGAFPARTYFDQRATIDSLESRSDELRSENEALAKEVEELGTDAEVERIAREEYGLAMPDEEIFYVVPPPEDPVSPPDAWPFDRLGQQLAR